MGHGFHKDKKLYFEHQRQNALKHVIPFIEGEFPLQPGMRVLEIGCAEGGVLKAFLDKGCLGTGVELSEARVEMAREFMKADVAAGKVSLISRNIYDVDFQNEFEGAFDLIVLKDVIEHIHDQKKLIGIMKSYLKPNGRIFFGFPPWMMPFGGHQQIARNKFLSRLPYYHLLPKFLYRPFLKAFKEPQRVIDELMEIKDTRITLERFERIVRQTGYTIAHKTLYLVNPIYEYKFGWKPRKQNKVVGGIPWFRNFFTTCGYYLIAPDSGSAGVRGYANKAAENQS